ncbi:MAG: anthranilate synthase component I [Deltaproteobacteria bacterium]|nr:anthranilate synthase component I [Deltaproteobacteria bacterium]
MELATTPQQRAFKTAGGLTGTRHDRPLDPATALNDVWQGLDAHKGGLLVSNYEVPNRYARWDIGFLAPPLELSAYGRRFELKALNGEGRRLLPLLAPALRHPHLEQVEEREDRITGLAQQPPAFFSEEERSRQPGFFSVVRALLAHLACGEEELGWYGAFGYDLVFQFETFDQTLPRDATKPDCRVFLPTRLVMVDRRKEQAVEVRFEFDTPQGPASQGGQGGDPLPPPPPRPAGEFTSDHTPQEFMAKVERVREGCRVGDHFEVVLSQTFSMPSGQPPTAIFRRLVKSNPSPYSFCLNLGEEQLVGASPEMFVRVAGSRVETSPISGTVPVGDSPMETARNIKELMASEKEESELTMCTDVDRNDLTRVCVPGSVKLIGRRLIEPYSRLVHTVDHLEGELAPGLDALDAFTTHLWACTVTGSPKPMALRVIESLEKSPRRWYSGAVGYVSAAGGMNTGMTLRTIHLENGWARVRAGATLLYDSTPALEERETRVKAQAFLEATLGETAPKPIPGGAARPRRAGEGRRVLFVDFLDSFVHTLASYVRVTGAQVTTVRWPFPPQLLDDLKPHLIFLSPGPGSPAERGVGQVVQLAVERNIPLFGVCLGHQGIGEFFGGKLGVLPTPVHGKPHPIHHQEQGFFKGLPNPFTAGRYHSLYLEPDSLPQELEVWARTQDGTIMAMGHKTLPICSVQFHPESILTLEQDAGQRLIENLFAVFLAKVGK